MRKQYTKFLRYGALAVLAFLALPISFGHTAPVTLTVTASFLVPLSVTGTNMAFGKIQFSSAPSVAGDFVKLGTDASTTFGGVFTDGDATANSQVGVAAVTAGTAGATVEVRCDSGAAASVHLTRTGGGAIDVTSVEVAAENTTGAFGTKSACNGTGGAAATTLVLNVGTLDDFRIGGKIDGATASAFVAGDYSTANAGGSALDVTLLYQ